MVRIGEYQQDRLASSLVGVPGLDSSPLGLANAMIGHNAVSVANSVGIGAGSGNSGQRALGFRQAGANIAAAIQQFSVAKQRRQAMIDQADTNNLKLEFGTALAQKAAEFRDAARIAPNPTATVTDSNKQLVDFKTQLMQDERLRGRSATMINSLDGFLTGKIGALSDRNFEFATNVSQANMDADSIDNLRKIQDSPFEAFNPQDLQARIAEIAPIGANLLKTRRANEVVGLVHNATVETMMQFFEGKTATEGIESANKLLYQGTPEDKNYYLRSLGSQRDQLLNRMGTMESARIQAFTTRNKVSRVESETRMHDAQMNYYGNDEIKPVQDAIKVMGMERDQWQKQYNNAQNDQEKLAISDGLQSVQSKLLSATAELKRRQDAVNAKHEQDMKEYKQAQQDAQMMDVQKIEALVRDDPVRAFNAATEKMKPLMSSENPEDRAALDKIITIRNQADSRVKEIKAQQKQEQIAAGATTYNNAYGVRTEIMRQFNELKRLKDGLDAKNSSDRTDMNEMIQAADRLRDSLEKARIDGALHPPGQTNSKFESMGAAVQSVYDVAAGRMNPKGLAAFFSNVKELPPVLKTHLDMVERNLKNEGLQLYPAERDSIEGRYAKWVDELKQKNPGVSEDIIKTQVNRATLSWIEKLIANKRDAKARGK